MNSLTLRDRMIQQQLVARGVRDARVLRAMRAVDRAQFVPAELVEFAYDDTPLPIDEDQTISQPYVVALMIEALDLKAGDRVLEVGAGSGYACAVASRVAAMVYGIERHVTLAQAAAERCRRLGFTNVHIRQGDGTLGWAEHGPFDAIMVAAGGPVVPPALQSQLAVGGRLVIPVGETPREQSLVRIRRTGPMRFEREDLGPVRFVPLIGAAGWHDPSGDPAAGARDFPTLVMREGEPFGTVEEASLEGLLDRIGDARVVCLGEASHGTAEFYSMRASITRALIERKRFTIVALEADWPEAQRMDRYVRNTTVEPHPEQAFDRFPTWMWANRQMMGFVEWLVSHNQGVPDPAHRVGVYGLDLYSLHRSAGAVLRYLEDVDPEAARVARHRYGCLDPWQADPAAYGAAVLAGAYKACEHEAVSILTDLLHDRLRHALRDTDRFFDAERNAQLVANAERYYRTMYYGTVGSWNLRDQHMFDTLDAVLRHRGSGSRAVVWAHNSHVGDAAWTEMGARGEHNIGRLCRARFGEDAFLVGFGTNHGTVAAASEWDGPMEIMEVRPAHPRSYEALCHSSGLPGFFLPLRNGSRVLRRRLSEERLERAIGVVYRPQTELESHYFTASLSRQFDEWVWLDETHAVDPLDVTAMEGMPQTYPFGV